MYSLVAFLPQHIHYKDNFNIRPFNPDWAEYCVKTWAQSQSVPKEHDVHPPAALQRGALRSRPVSALKQGLLRPLSAINHHCSSIKAWLQDWLGRNGGIKANEYYWACLCGGTESAGDKWTAMMVSVCHRDVRHSSASRAALFRSLSQDSAIRRGWTENHDRDGAHPPSITHHREAEAPHPPLVCTVACCQAPWIKPVWLCGLCKTLFAMSASMPVLFPVVCT